MDIGRIFHRPELAARLAAVLLGDDPLSSAGQSGLFLSAPRRTGKSTFLRNDLIPAVEHAGAIAIYVDLWADKTRDPGDLITEAMRDTLALQASKLLSALRALKRIKKAGAKGELAGFRGEFGFELETVGQSQGTTLVKAFEALHRRVKRPIVFVLDEAQHALSSPRGADTLFALKTARDALNITSAKPPLAILATGSARAKIAEMVMRKNQPFYGASTETFPPLGDAFVTHFARQLLAHRIPESHMPHTEQLLKAFQMLGSRPEDFRTAVRDALVRPESDLGAALSVLQRAIVKRMVASSDPPAPFSRDSIAYYRGEIGDSRVSSSAVQKAMDALVAKGFVWRSARGVYALDDATTAELFYDDRVQDALLRDLTSPHS